MKKKTRPRRPDGRVVLVSELKARLSAYLARVKRGEEIVVTERGEPIARIVPLELPTGNQWERIRRLEREGVIRVQGNGRIPEDFWALPRPARVPGGAAVDAVIAERREGL